MRKYLLILLLLPSVTFSQYVWDYGVVAGGSSSLGETGGKEKTRRDWLLDMKLPATRWSVGAFGRYKIHPQWYGKVTLNYLRLYGHDKFSTNAGRRGRNLSFRNDMFELFGTVERVLHHDADFGNTGRYSVEFDVMAYGGLGGLYHNPKGELNGKWIKLQPLMTEGQDKPYKRLQFIVPIGGELFWTFRTRTNEKHRLGLDFNWRMTWTDYIDDISTTYANLSDPTAAAVANKSDAVYAETGGAGLPERFNYIPGSKRGEPDNDDHYITLSITYAKVIRGKSNFYRKRYGFANKRRKGVRRRSRAKF